MNLMFARYGLVTGLVDDGKTLLFTISERCFGKKELKRSAFLLKLEKKCYREFGGMQRPFLSLNIRSYCFRA